MTRTGWTVLVVAVAVSSVTLLAEPPGPDTTLPGGGATSPAPIADRDLSLYPGSVFEVPAPRGFVWNATDPGENPRLARAYPNAPPRIPHGIGDFLPITRTSHACLDCHLVAGEEEVPQVPASHRTDLRHAPDRVGTALAGARRDCVACHVPTSDAPPLRANSAAPR